MTHYDIFRGHLASKYPAYGHALWDPSPPRLYCIVPWRLATSASYAKADSTVVPKLSDHIIHGTLGISHYYSDGIDVAAAEPVWSIG
jgi:hypothetical protein